MYKIWIWQCIVSPHMAGLASALAEQGHEVTYVAEQRLSSDRAAQGWSAPAMPGVRLEMLDSAAAIDRLLSLAPVDCIHITQGLRGNGRIREVQAALASVGHRYWVAMETVDNSGLKGAARRWEYSLLVRQKLPSLHGVLAIGHTTGAWLAARGVPADRVFPFAYFLQDKSPGTENPRMEAAAFRFVYVGQLIERKRVDLLLDALATADYKSFELAIIGSGPEEGALRNKVDGAPALRESVRFLGTLPMDTAHFAIAQADCLVLPSRYDGWGAVVSEALQAGTRAVCSDACGSAGAVRASGVGGVFRAGDREDLRSLLHEQLAHGPVSATERQRVSLWAQCLGARAGAKYLSEILDHRASGSERPLPPWEPVT